MDKKALVTRYRSLVSLACRCSNFLRSSRKIKGQDNRIEAPCALMKGTKIRISGHNNRVILEDFSVLDHGTVTIHGSNNTIRVGSWSRLNGTDLFIEDDGNRIEIGEHGRLYGYVELAAMEGTSITVGPDCLFSSDVRFRTGDSHSVLDLSGRRINASRSITVGEHVWFGRNVTLLKGAEIGSHCILGTGAVVTGKFPESNCSVAGVPAKVIKKGVDWSLRRIPLGETAEDFQAPSCVQEESE